MKNAIKIKNPFAKVENYNCFGCSHTNEHGLKLDFYDMGDYLQASYNPDSSLQGWIGVLHGGIQTTLVDEIASWFVFVKLKTAGVTSRIDVKLRKPVFVADGPIKVMAKLIEVQKNIASIAVELRNSKDEKCLDGTIYYYLFSEEVARQKYNYPGLEAFY